MKRLVFNQLTEWKNKAKRKPLVVTGARQCGKTYAIKEFGTQEFKNLAYFNFEGNEALKSIFDYDLNVKRIVEELAIYSSQKIEAGKTLLFFDEIQACPKAITSLKYFCEDMPGLHVIAAGSLLGVVIRQEEISFPVGKVERLQMYPMSFEEFVTASENGESLLKAARANNLQEPLRAVFAESLEKLLRYYYIVGGMPEAVATFYETKNLDAVSQVLANILQDYSDDFSKHAPTTDIPKRQLIWDSVPKQLAKDNNKFVFSHVKAGKRAADLEDALQWLFNAGLLHKLECVTSAELPLSNNADGTCFKVYMNDVGLLRVKSGLDAQTILNDTPLYATFKGALTENFVHNELVKQGIHPHFWRSCNTAELDFLLEIRNELYPIEVKAEKHTKAKSYSQFCQKYSPKKGLKLSMKNISVTDVHGTETLQLPLYMSFRIRG